MEEQTGYRTQRRINQKKRARRVQIGLGTLVVLIVAFVILGGVVKLYPFDVAWDKTTGAFKWFGSKVASIWPGGSDAPETLSNFVPEGMETMNMLFGITKSTGETTTLTTIMLFSYDSRDGTASITYFPNDLLVDIPGSGLDQMINMVETGEGSFDLVTLSVENILGINVDRYVLGMDRDVKIILKQIAKYFPVEVTEELEWNDKSLDVKVSLEPGEQNLSDGELASYLTFSRLTQETDLIDRQKRFLPVFLDASKKKLDEAEELAKENANLFDTDASGTEIWGLWAELAEMDSEKLTQGTIPTQEFRFESTVVHRVDDKELEDYVKKNIKSASEEGGEERVKLEILNGCGVPGIGKEVATELDLTEFNIVSSGNASSFEYPESVIIIYGDSSDKEMVSAAERVRNALEVGRIEFHQESGSMADITAIVGRDYSSK